MLSSQSLDTLLAQPRTPVRRGAESPIAAYAGLWKGTFHPAGAGAVSFTVHQEGVLAGELPVLRFPTRAIPPVALRLVEASVTAYIAVTEPYTDPASGERVTLHIEGRRERNRLVGTCTIRRADGSAVRAGAFTALRYGSAASVNYRW